jgi:GYF domain 2
MTIQIPQENSTVIPVSFGIGLLLAGRYVLGTAAIAIGIVAHFRSNYFKAKRKELAHKKPLVRWHELTFQEKLSSVDQWHYADNEKSVGPMDERAILQLLKDNKISKDTLIYNPVLSDKWVPFGLTNLFQNRMTTG